MPVLQIRKCDFIFGYNGVDYNLTAETDAWSIEDPQAKHLTRGSSTTNKRGIIITEGTKDPRVITITLIAPAAEYLKMFKEIYNDEERVDFSIIDRVNGSKRTLKEAIIQKEPMQATMGEGADELNISLVIETYQIEDKE
jgi:hypothetical protein